jgi:hypothetical protein
MPHKIRSLPQPDYANFLEIHSKIFDKQMLSICTKPVRVYAYRRYEKSQIFQFLLCKNICVNT